MTQKFIIAENLFTVTASGEIPAWTSLHDRFSPFASDSADQPVFEVAIKCTELPSYPDAETIYAPKFNGIGTTTSKTFRLPNGDIAIEFRTIDESEGRIMLTMSAMNDRAEIVISAKEDPNDRYLLAHAMMIAFMLAAAKTRTLIIHSSVVTLDGKAYLFQGKSGTGKSTHANLWLKHIPGAERLNDDNPVLRFSADGIATVYGSPWSGKTDCYRNASSPIDAFVRIVRSADNELHPLSPLKAYASLTASVCYLPFMSEAERTIRHEEIERLAMTTPCYEMHCRPDAEAARVCKASLCSASNK